MSTASQISSFVRNHLSQHTATYPGQFLGVFASDELPPITRWVPGTSLVVNYDPHNADGSHWCCIVWPRWSPFVWWVDSFGLAPDYDDRILHDRTAFRVYLDSISASAGVAWRSSTAEMQSLTTSVCGHYASLACLGGPLQDSQPPHNLIWNELAGMAQPQRDRRLRELVPLTLNSGMAGSGFTITFGGHHVASGISGRAVATSATSAVPAGNFGNIIDAAMHAMP